MTEIITEVANIDLEQLFDDERAATERRTYTHENADHCEADAAGRAIVGVTDADGRVLLAVNPKESHTILPNETVAPDEDWATVGRDRVEGLASIDVTLDGVERVRRVEHVVGDESTSRSPTTSSSARRLRRPERFLTGCARTTRGNSAGTTNSPSMPTMTTREFSPTSACSSTDHLVQFTTTNYTRHDQNARRYHRLGPLLDGGRR